MPRIKRVLTYAAAAAVMFWSADQIMQVGAALHDATHPHGSVSRQPT